jgi:hypothetical protein
VTREERERLRDLISAAQRQRVRLELISGGRGLCERCGEPFDPLSRGRPRQFCSDPCRLRAWRDQKRAA